VTPRPYATVSSSRATLRFYLGDCLTLLPALAPGSASAIVTSPPYNLGVRYRSYQDTLPRERYLHWTGDWIQAAKRVLAPNGSLFLNVGAKPTDPWTAIDIALAARPHLLLQNTLHWVKSVAIDRDAAGAASGIDSDLALGHYKPINSPRFVNDCHEFVFHFTSSGRVPVDRLALGVPYQDQSNVTRWRSAGGGRRCRGNVWFLPYETIQNRDEDRPHPATFPSRLPDFCLRLHGLSRLRTVVDPFLGLGSSAVACARLGVDFIGMELDEAYLQEAIDRARESLAEPAKEKRPPKGVRPATAARRSS